MNSSDHLAARHIGGYTPSLIEERWTGPLHGRLIRTYIWLRSAYLGLGSVTVAGLRLVRTWHLASAAICRTVQGISDLSSGECGFPAKLLSGGGNATEIVPCSGSTKEYPSSIHRMLSSSRAFFFANVSPTRDLRASIS